MQESAQTTLKRAMALLAALLLSFSVLQGARGAWAEGEGIAEEAVTEATEESAPEITELPAEPYEQIARAGNVKVAVKAAAGVFAPGAVLNIAAASDGEFSAAAARAALDGAGENTVIRHSQISFSGAEMNGSAQVTIECPLLSELQDQYPDGNIRVFLYRYDADAKQPEERARRVSAAVNLTKQQAEFTLSAPGIYDLVILVSLPAPEPALEAEATEAEEAPGEVTEPENEANEPVVEEISDEASESEAGTEEPVVEEESDEAAEPEVVEEEPATEEEPDEAAESEIITEEPVAEEEPDEVTEPEIVTEEPVTKEEPDEAAEPEIVTEETITEEEPDEAAEPEIATEEPVTEEEPGEAAEPEVETEEPVAEEEPGEAAEPEVDTEEPVAEEKPDEVTEPEVVAEAPIVEEESGEAAEPEPETEEIGKAIEPEAITEEKVIEEEPGEGEETAAEPEAADQAVPEAQVEEAKQSVTAEKSVRLPGKGCSVIVRYDTASGIPADAMLIVSEISDPARQDSYLRSVQSALNGEEESGAQELYLLDISLISNGVNYAGAFRYQVEIVLDDIAEAEDVQAIQFTDDRPVLLATEAEGGNETLRINFHSANE